MALYVDKASHFKTTRYAGVHYDVSVEQEETNIERALIKDLKGLPMANIILVGTDIKAAADADGF